MKKERFWREDKSLLAFLQTLIFNARVRSSELSTPVFPRRQVI